jgi:endonuclease/exonuclease/phosphatase family metal-dependent hydrolase
MSWNIQFGEGTDAITNYDRTASWIAANNPDVVDMCEVPIDSVPVLVGLLTQKTGRVWFSQFVPKYVGTDEGNLILSWHSFVSVNGKFLSVNRSVAQATINISGQNVNFFATHLDDGSSSNRVVEAGELKSWASNFSEPRVVTGDFNGGPDTAEALSMTDSYIDSWSRSMDMGTAVSYPDNPVGMHTRTRRGRIDYVFYASQDATLALRTARIPDSRDLNNPNVVIRLGTADDAGVRPSDHNFVVADFDLNAGGGPTPTPTPTPTPNPTATPTPTPTPAPTLTTPPLLLTDVSTGRGLALQSPLFMREPFSLTSPLNSGTDKRTRVILFCANLNLLPGESISVVTARAVTPSGAIYNLPVEAVDPVTDLSLITEVVVVLPDIPSFQGDLSVAVALRGIGSNSVTIGVGP